MDEIIIENLKVFAHHGVYKEENENGQNFYVNAVLYADTRRAGREDRRELVTSYGDVCQFMYTFISENLFMLLETVAEKTAEAVLSEFPLLEGITLEIRKPEAPIDLEFESVSVKITRMWHNVCLATGSNMGNRPKYITGNRNMLREEKSKMQRNVSHAFPWDYYVTNRKQQHRG